MNTTLNLTAISSPQILRCLCYHVFNRVQIFFVSLYLSDELKEAGYILKETITY